MEFPRTFGTKLKNTLQPTNTEIVSLRPLTYGIDTVHPRSMSKLRELRNLYPAEDGWRSRPGVRPMMARIPIESTERIRDYIDMGIISTYATFVAVSNLYLYQTGDGETWERCPWKRDKYTASADPDGGTTIACATSFTTDGVTAAMYVMFKDSSSNYTLGPYEISTVAANSLGVATTISGTDSRDFRIYYRFAALAPYSVQWTKGPDKIYLVDTSSVGILAFDGKYLSSYAIHSEEEGAAPFSGACAIFYIDGRLVVGNTTETGGYRMLRWSQVVDMSEFQTINYVAFTQSSTPLMSIHSLENYLVIAMQSEDMYVGKPYSGDLIYSMPWLFKKLETSGIAPVGQNAIVSALNAIIFIGNDDVYMLSFAALNAQGDFQVKPVECKVRNQIFDGSSMNDALVLYEPRTQNILFTFSRPFSMLWAMNAKTAEWSKWTFPVEFTSMARSTFAPRITYAAAVAAGWTYADLIAEGKSYQAFLMGDTASYTTFVQEDGTQYIFDFTAFVDMAPGTTQLAPEIETGDMDFDAPDDDKTIYRFGILIEGQMNMLLRGSSSRGSTWKDLTLASTPVQILNGEEELHFRLSGDKLSMKITIPVLYSKLVIEGLTMSVKVTGENVIRGG